MKREHMTFALCSAAVLLASAIGFSCMMCLVQAFGLTCRPEQLIFVCCAVSGFAVAAMAVRHGWIAFMLALIAYLAVLIWKLEQVSLGVQSLLYEVTYAYSLCFENVAVLGVPGNSAQWLLSVLAAPLVWLSVWVICREGHAALVALACSPVLVLCLIVVDLAPIFWLLLLSAALLLLIMSGHVRAHSANDGGKLIWWLLPPVLLVFFVLTVLSPVQTYVRSEWATDLQRIAEGNFDFTVWQDKIATAVSAGWSGELKREDLGKAGPRMKTGAPVMEYRSEVEIRYLRGSSLGYYEDNCWHNVELDGLTAIPEGTGTAVAQIRTAYTHPQLYLPYFAASVPAEGLAVDDGYIKNKDQVKEYTVTFDPEHTGTGYLSEEYRAFVYDTYLQLPQELETPLRQFLTDAGLMQPAAWEICDLVKNNAVYDLNTPAVPAGEDFVLYFLTQSKQGYCVHFASSAVLLLRCAGYPARYVTGYAAGGEAGQWNTVTLDAAHAWAEYYVDGMGWIPLEPTPADFREETEQPPGQEPTRDEEPDAPNVPDKEPTMPPEREETQTHLVPEASQPGAREGKGAWWIIVPAAVLLIFLRRQAILFCRRMRQKRAHPNRKTLDLWNRLLQLYKAQGLAIPEQWICLAEKAKFSQHRIGEEELAQIAGAVREQTEQVKKAPFHRRLWYRYGLVLY